MADHTSGAPEADSAARSVMRAEWMVPAFWCLAHGWRGMWRPGRVWGFFPVPASLCSASRSSHPWPPLTLSSSWCCLSSPACPACPSVYVSLLDAERQSAVTLPVWDTEPCCTVAGEGWTRGPRSPADVTLSSPPRGPLLAFHEGCKSQFPP